MGSKEKKYLWLTRLLMTSWVLPPFDDPSPIFSVMASRIVGPRPQRRAAGQRVGRIYSRQCPKRAKGDHRKAARPSKS